MEILNIINGLCLYNKLWIHEEKQIPSEELLYLSEWSALSALLIIFLVLVIICLYFKCHKNRRFITNMPLTWLFVCIWMVNFVVYDVGMYTGEQISLWTNIPMAIIYAFGVFILESDVSAIHEQFHNSWLFMAAFSLAHFLAAFVSLMFVIKHFGYNILVGLRLFYASSWFAASKKTTYIFWGMERCYIHISKEH